ncbi:MAG: hypothetical protein WC860_02920 [Candidatus Margulisiibacteriota bacterium]|jgi:hypothetical protein
MKKLTLSFLFGALAGLIDVIPMILQGLNWYANASAFMQWLILGVVISHIEILGLKSWLKGLIVAECAVIPIEIIVAQNGAITIIPILIMTAILGSLIGFVSEKFRV